VSKVTIFISLGALSVLGGAGNMNRLDLGVGAVGIGCFFAILARIAQASAHHAEVLEATRRTTGAMAEVADRVTARKQVFDADVL